MTQVSSTGPDQADVHHYIRVFGHRPSPAELARYESARVRRSVPWHSRARHRVARMIVWGLRPQP